MIGFLDLAQLEVIDGKPSIFCLLIRQNLIGDKSISTIHFYPSEKSRQNGLRHWQHAYKIFDTIFFACEIPINLFLETAQKLV